MIINEPAMYVTCTFIALLLSGGLEMVDEFVSSVFFPPSLLMTTSTKKKKKELEEKRRGYEKKGKQEKRENKKIKKQGSYWKVMRKRMISVLESFCFYHEMCIVLGQKHEKTLRPAPFPLPLSFPSPEPPEKTPQQKVLCVVCYEEHQTLSINISQSAAVKTFFVQPNFCFLLVKTRKTENSSEVG